MDKEIIFRPAWDRRSPDPKKNYGIHGVEMVWSLRGSKGAIVWVVFTNWHPSHTQEELDSRAREPFPHLLCHPQPADLGCHTYAPQYESQKRSQEKCTFLKDEPCYYDGSGLQAEKIYQILVSEGSVGVWKELAKHYDLWIEKMEGG